jgi:hypothetical protein
VRGTETVYSPVTLRYTGLMPTKTYSYKAQYDRLMKAQRFVHAAMQELETAAEYEKRAPVPAPEYLELCAKSGCYRLLNAIDVLFAGLTVVSPAIETLAKQSLEKGTP